jgi:hypothetical protein
MSGPVAVENAIAFGDALHIGATVDDFNAALDYVLLMLEDAVSLFSRGSLHFRPSQHCSAGRGREGARWNLAA